MGSANHASPTRPASSTARFIFAAIQMGGAGFCLGVGRTMQSSKLKCLPW